MKTEIKRGRGRPKKETPKYDHPVKVNLTKEQADKLVSVRSRFEGNEGQKPLAQFIAEIKEEIDTKAIRTELPEEEKKR